MLSKNVGGEWVKGGTYWSGGGWQFISVPPEGGRLVGGQGDWYVRAPLLLVLVAGSLMGLAFVIFLPLSGLLIAVPFLARKAADTVTAGKLTAAQMAAPGLQPGVSYLQPSIPSRQEEETRIGAHDGSGEGKVVDLAEEIAEKRWLGR